MHSRSQTRPDWMLATARALLLLLIFSLAFMKPAFLLLDRHAVPTDLIFVATVLAWLAALTFQRTELRWRNAYWLLLAYFAAMAVSGLRDPGVAFSKLATQVYLLSLPVLADQLIQNREQLRAAILAWLVGTAIVGIIAAASLALFLWDPAHPLLYHVRFHFGTLPPGSYPRLNLTFVNANMVCNYLTGSLCILLAARHFGWVTARPFGLLLAGILVAAASTISPGLAGLVFAGALWLWLVWRERRPGLARLSLLAGLGAAVTSIPAMAFTPVLHSTAAFVIDLPGLTLAPAGRLMIWTDAVRNFLADPWIGRGIGQDTVLVRYRDPSGFLQLLTEAHNSFLNIAVQCGVVGLSAFIAILVGAARIMGPLRLTQSNALRLGLGLAFLNGIALQGLGGSFEDARHLWVAFGLLLVAERLERSSA